MIKKSTFIVAGLTLLLSLNAAGCGNAGNEGQAFDFMRGYKMEEPSQAINKSNIENKDQYLQFGYNRQTKNAAQDLEMPGYAVYDRPLLAESISEMAAVIPEVRDAGVLVTDQYVLIAYETAANDREAVADQVKKTAMSVVPSYYEVYVADDPIMMDEIERFGGQYSENRAEMNALLQTIDQMKTYPQGETDSPKPAETME
jgi:hypothetical protein